MSTFLLIRHGEAEGNRSGRLIGQTKAPLTLLGRLQTDRLTDRLARVKIDQMVSSDLPRALQTAQPLADRLATTIIREPLLREIANGEWSDLMPVQVAAQWPDLWRRYRQGEDVARPGGETWADVGRRAVDTLTGLADESANTIAIFTHGGPIIQLVRWVTGISYERHVYTGPFAPPANCSVTVIQASTSTRGLISYNDCGHLEGLLEGVSLNPIPPVTGSE